MHSQKLIKAIQLYQEFERVKKEISEEKGSKNTVEIIKKMQKANELFSRALTIYGKRPDYSLSETTARDWGLVGEAELDSLLSELEKSAHKIGYYAS